MPKVAIADTSCLIILKKIGLLELLDGLYDEKFITPQIAKEYRDPLPEKIKVAIPKNANAYQEWTPYLDEGEVSAIALAVEIGDIDHRYFGLVGISQGTGSY